MSRRALLGTGLTAATAAVAIAAARAGGVLDDALRGVGVEPHPEPDPGDTRRLSRAAAAQAGLIAAIDATIDQHSDLESGLGPLRLVADEQLVAVSGRLAATDAATPPTDAKDAAAELARLAADSAERARGRRRVRRLARRRPRARLDVGGAVPARRGLRTGRTMTRLDDLQAWLALEHEAVWLYGMIGARVDTLAKPARTSYDAHRVGPRPAPCAGRARPAAIRSDRPSPTATSVIDSAKEARAAASNVEERIAAACVTLFGGADKDGRRFAMSGLRRAALAALDWGAPVRAFPGLD